MLKLSYHFLRILVKNEQLALTSPAHKQLLHGSYYAKKEKKDGMEMENKSKKLQLCTKLISKIRLRKDEIKTKQKNFTKFHLNLSQLKRQHHALVLVLRFDVHFGNPMYVGHHDTILSDFCSSDTATFSNPKKPTMMTIYFNRFAFTVHKLQKIFKITSNYLFELFAKTVDKFRVVPCRIETNWLLFRKQTRKIEENK